MVVEVVLDVMLEVVVEVAVEVVVLVSVVVWVPSTASSKGKRTRRALCVDFAIMTSATKAKKRTPHISARPPATRPVLNARTLLLSSK